jgi:hypothetical protein
MSAVAGRTAPVDAGTGDLNWLCVVCLTWYAPAQYLLGDSSAPDMLELY